MTTYYEVLGIKSTASLDEIKSAYKRLVVKYHPDTNNGSAEYKDIFQKICDAFNVLKDPNKRAEYNRTIKVKESVYSYNSIKRSYSQSYSKYTSTNWKYVKDRIQTDQFRDTITEFDNPAWMKSVLKDIIR